MAATANGVVFPWRAEQITAEVMTDLLRRRHPGVEVREVEIVERARCGDGVASTADRILLSLDYAPSTADGLPARMVLKTLLLNPMLRFGMGAIEALSGSLDRAQSVPLVGGRLRDALLAIVAGYQRLYPHAPDAMYANEVRFYEQLRPELPIEAPVGYAGAFDPASGQFGLLMEDLRERGARFPNARDSAPLDTVRDVLDNLATLHARHWQSPELAGALSWLPTGTSGGMFPVFNAIGAELIRGQVRDHACKREVVDTLGRGVDDLWADMWRAERWLERTQPQALLHGDTHTGNTYWLPGGKGGLLDFQLMVKGCWAHDVAYLLVTSLDTEVRRREQPALVQYYLARLSAHGVEDVPDEAHADRCLGIAILWGLVIGWMITPPQNYGEDITRANLRRLVAAVQDMDTLALVAEL